MFSLQVRKRCRKHTTLSKQQNSQLISRIQTDFNSNAAQKWEKTQNNQTAGTMSCMSHFIFFQNTVPLKATAAYL